MVSFALGLTVAGLVARALLAPGSAAPRSVVQFEVNPPPMPVAFVPEGANPRSFAVSPDGTAVVYRGFRGGVPRLFLRSMADGDVRELRGTERVGVLTPFWSPDGDWIGFERGQGLERVPLEGGSPIAIAQVESQQLRSAAWGEDDSIVFARGNTLFRVSAGRRPEALFETAGAGWLDDVELLPGGNVALVSVVTFAVDADRTDLAAVVFGDEELRVLIEQRTILIFCPPAISCMRRTMRCGRSASIPRNSRFRGSPSVSGTTSGPRSFTPWPMSTWRVTAPWCTSAPISSSETGGA